MANGIPTPVLCAEPPPLADERKNAYKAVFHGTVFDAENRLIAAQTSTNLPASVPRKKVEFTYDYMSRRVGKTVYSGLTNNNYQITNNSSFLYDGWNLISELITDNGSLITNSYVWGLDLSGSLQGAGGIGGLIAANIGTNSCLYTYDGNGNVSDLVDSQSGSIAAHYEFSPFGETVVATGPLARANPFRFSTKYTDDEIAMLYYGYRFYHPGVGRWLSRDPIGDKGWGDVYRYVNNNPNNKFDSLGLFTWESLVSDFTHWEKGKVIGSEYFEFGYYLGGLTILRQWDSGAHIEKGEDNKWWADADGKARVEWMAEDDSVPHERHHLMIFASWWTRLYSKVATLVNRPGCYYKAKYCEQAIEFYAAAYEWGARAEQYQLDDVATGDVNRHAKYYERAATRLYQYFLEHAAKFECGCANLP